MNANKTAEEKSLTPITQENSEQYWTSPGGNIPQNSNCSANYHTSPKLSKLDYRRIFTISGSNEQLQQELEHTLLKPDCHSWWISKMQSGRQDTLEERYAIKSCFKLGKNATETYGMLQTAFRLSCMHRASVFEWHKRFKEGRESVRDDERCRRSKEVNTPELIG